MTDVKPTGTDQAHGKGKETSRRARTLGVIGTMTATLRAKGGITLPQAVRERLHLEEGDQVIVTEQDGSIVLTPATVIPRDQEWFWTPEWQAKEAEADADKATGRYTRFNSDEDFLNALAELD